MEQIYTHKVSECLERAKACEEFLNLYLANKDIYSFESAVLQLRKSLESMAMASIAPNKSVYEAYRAKAENSPDFTKDYNAAKILKNLEAINKDFYPVALIKPTLIAPGQWHFDRKTSGFLTKKKFQKIYDRLGKYLHSDNPWSGNKGVENMAKEIPKIIQELGELLEWHATFIRTPKFKGVLVVESYSANGKPRTIVAFTNGDFTLG